MNRKQRRMRNKRAENVTAPQVLMKAKTPEIQKLFDKGRSLLKQGDHAQASQIFASLMQKDPAYLPAYEFMGVTCMEMEKFDEALNFFNVLLKVDAKNSDRYHAYIGGVYMHSGRHEEAITILEDVSKRITLDAIHSHLGTSYMYMGDKEKSRWHLEKAMDLSPDVVNYLYNYVQGVYKFENEDDPLINRINDLYKKKDQFKNEDKARICYMKFKALNDLKRYEEAIPFAEEGAAIHRQDLQYERKTYKAFSTYLRKYFSKSFFENVHFENLQNSDRPIFVLSMPRAGTTLLDQILSTHPDIGSIGEDPFLNDLVRDKSALPRFGDIRYPVMASSKREEPFFPPDKISKRSEWLAE